MRAVIDTNIIIRAVIKPKGTVGAVLDRLRDGEYTAVYSEPLLNELLAKLALPRIRDKYSITDSDVADLLTLLALRGELVRPERNVEVCRDADDDKVIEAALAGEAEWEVTGDQDLLCPASTIFSLQRQLEFPLPQVFLTDDVATSHQRSGVLDQGPAATEGA